MRLRLLLTLLLLGLCVPHFLYAATVYFGVDTFSVPKDKVFEVGVFVNTEGETVNAVSGAVTFPASVSVDRIEYGASLLSLWVTRPQVTDGKVVYEGILPGGFTGSDLYLFSLFVSAKEIGDITIASTNDRVLLNDGAGTDARVHAAALTLKVEETGEVRPTESKDIDQPEPFTPAVVNDPALYDGRATLIFATADKDSGIDHYEVLERRAGIFSFFSLSSWTVAESPYLLRDQSLQSDVSVRAIDKSGNVRDEKLAAKFGPPIYERSEFFGILALIIVFVFVSVIGRKKIWGKRRGGRSRR